MLSTQATNFPETIPTDVLSREPELETILHLEQMILLITCLKWWWRDRQDFFAEGNISIYYRPEQIQSELGTQPDDTDDRQSSRFRGPDFFVVLGVEQKERSSWIVWQEDNRYPNLIVEILSKGTAKADRGLKKQLYQDIFKTPEYFWFDPRPEKLEFTGFRLREGKYVEIPPNEKKWCWSQELGLYLGVEHGKLRYFTPEGMLVPTPAEEAIRQQQRAESERQRAEQLAERLKALGVDPDSP